MKGRSRCAECQKANSAAREVRRAAERLQREPWRILYGRAEWKKARARRREMDDFRCVDCGSPGDPTKLGMGLNVDHVVKLRDLYERAASWADFERLACDVSLLRTRCGPCHRLADADDDE